MIIDVHSHAWLFPDHFTDNFRKQAQDLARADKPLDLSVTYESLGFIERDFSKSLSAFSKSFILS